MAIPMTHASPYALIAETAQFVPTGVAARCLGRHPDTLKAMRMRGEIECIRSASGRCLWNIGGFLARVAQKVEAQRVA